MGIDAEMFVRTTKRPTEKEIARLSHRLVSAFGIDDFLIQQEATPWGSAHHALSIVDTWTQDGPDILPEPGETFIRVHLWCRYYGVGYERGPATLIASVAAWLEANEVGEVWYGGDSSGVCAERFGPDERAALLAHYYVNGHEPYRSFFGFGAVKPTCAFCGDAPMVSSGGGGDREWFSCGGCFTRATVRTVAGRSTTEIGIIPKNKRGEKHDFGIFPGEPAWVSP